MYEMNNFLHPFLSNSVLFREILIILGILFYFFVIFCKLGVNRFEIIRII